MNTGAADELKRQLSAAFAFFSLFGQPLTPLEAARWRLGLSGTVPKGDCPRPVAPSLSDVFTEMRKLHLKEKDGYFSLADSDDLNVEKRHRRLRQGEINFKRALVFARWVRHLSSVRLVAVCNSLAFSTSDINSDIDIFIVCRPGTLWATRLLIVGALHVLGLRPTPQHQAGRLCLSFFLAEDKLDMARFAIGPDDVYLTYWLATLIPIYDAGGVYEKMLSANPWLLKQLPGWQPLAQGPRREVQPSRLVLPTLATQMLEPLASSLQRRFLPKAIRQLANLDTRVVIAPDVLKFHVNDRRAEYRDRFLERRRALTDNV